MANYQKLDSSLVLVDSLNIALQDAGIDPLSIPGRKLTLSIFKASLEFAKEFHREIMA